MADMMDLKTLCTFYWAVEYGEHELIADHIESGGSLDGLDDYCRSALAALIRGQNPRGRGVHKKDRSIEERNRKILREIAIAQGSGLHVYHDGGPVESVEACALVAEKFGLQRDTVRDLWASRTETVSLRVYRELGNDLASQLGKPYPFD